ncbi:hypothetical protein V8E36_007163 [Tilletia maclaganii]
MPQQQQSGPSYSDLQIGGGGSYDAGEQSSSYGFDPATGHVIQRSASLCLPPQNLYPHQQYQQAQQHPQMQPQQQPQQHFGPYDAAPHEASGAVAEHEVDRRTSIHPNFGFGHHALHEQRAFAAPLQQQQQQQQQMTEAQAHEMHLNASRQQHQQHQQPKSLRQQVLTPTFAQHAQFAAAGGAIGQSPNSAASEAGAIVMARSSSLPHLFGQREFNSPALSLDTSSTFTPDMSVAGGGAGQHLFASFSGGPSSSSTMFYGGGGSGGAPDCSSSEHMPSPELGFVADAAAAAAAAAAASMGGEMSYDLSSMSADTTLCDATSMQSKLSAAEHHHHHLHMLHHGALAEGHIPAHFADGVRRYGSGEAGGFHQHHLGEPFPPVLGADPAVFGPGTVPLRRTKSLFAPSTQPAPTTETSQASASNIAATATDTVDTKQHPGRRPPLPANESTKYSISTLLAITRAAEADPSIFPCPFCDKSYEGKHGRSIWRRHLQDKHAIPLSAQPRRTRWDSDVNRPKNDEERRQRMLESKRRWAQKRRCQKMLEQGAQVAAAAAAAAVEEAEKSQMGEEVIEQMRAWYEYAKAQMLDVMTPGRARFLAGLDEGQHEGELMGAEYEDEGEDEDGDGEDFGEEDGGGFAEGGVEAGPSASQQTLGAHLRVVDGKTSLTPGRPTAADANGISPRSPFALPSWLDQQPPSLRAAALAAIEAQRAEMKSRKRAAAGQDPDSANKSASKRRPSSSEVALAMNRTTSMPAYSEDMKMHLRASAMKRTSSHHHAPLLTSSTTVWDPFVVPLLPTRGLGENSSGDEPGSGMDPLAHKQSEQGAFSKNLAVPAVHFPTSAMPSAVKKALGPEALNYPHEGSNHHVGGVDHSPTPASRRAGAMAGAGTAPMMSSSSLASSPVRKIRGPMRAPDGSVVIDNLALRQPAVSTPVGEEPPPVSSSSPFSLGAAIALGNPPLIEPAGSGSAHDANVPSNPFSLEKHKISPSQPSKVPGGLERRKSSHDFVRPLLNPPNDALPVRAAIADSLATSPGFAMSRHLPPLPGLNERGEDPMMAPDTTSRKTDDALGLSTLVGMDTPLRMFAGAIAKSESLPFLLGTPRPRNRRQRETTGTLSTTLLSGGNMLASTSTTAAVGLHALPAASRPTTATGAAAPLATPDRFTQPRGLSSVFRNLGGTPSAGFRFDMERSPHSALMSIGNLGNAPLSTSKSWGTLSSAMLEWPMAGGVELSPIRTKLPLGERRDAINLPFASAHGGGGPHDSGREHRSGSPLSFGFHSKSGSGSESGFGSPVLRSTTSASGSAALSALGAALTRPRGLSSLTKGHAGAAKRTWGAENDVRAFQGGGTHEWKRLRV